MAIGGIVPLPKSQLIDINGAPYAGATILTYVPGTTTPADTFQDQLLTTPNQNPIVADDLGMFTAWANADFRYVAHDVNGVLIYDADTSTPLPASLVSTFMEPILGSENSTQFLDLSGTQAAIAAAVAAVMTLVGPQGIQGVPGVAGPQGIQGVPGNAASSATWVAGNPAYVTFPGLNNGSNVLLICWGTGATGGGGSQSVNFPLQYQTAPPVVIAMCTAASWWANVTSTTGTQFQVTTSSPLASGNWRAPAPFWWISIGV